MHTAHLIALAAGDNTTDTITIGVPWVLGIAAFLVFGAGHKIIGALLAIACGVYLTGTAFGDTIRAVIEPALSAIGLL